MKNQKNKQFNEMPETHCTGMITIENIDLIKQMVTNSVDDMNNADLGLQISEDGRVWVCINGMALLRFKPALKKYNE